MRPTPDRIRETLFNWLQPVIMGARCLDLFAGSGALGLEASSRGAARVVMVEKNLQACREIRSHVEVFAAKQVEVEVVTADSLAYLQSCSSQRFDIVFLDPPFESNLLGLSCASLERNDCLAIGSYIYLESRGCSGLPALPCTWNLLHSKQAGEVGYYLARKEFSLLEAKSTVN
ncbi:methyltransferase [Candidatus Nitrosoglobus terrae]|uniref:Ribosomal RNA small subunit methyltransferase D n=1 Tax=Candidatus Nitrosoglobus terrae TaxID=1630141 RepID=A0A1Q2SPC1_9GAMM|nr:methyltransferase [Candidatus Nitrosoglobus terrae]